MSNPWHANYYFRKNKGFAALTTVLILSAIFLLIFIGMFTGTVVEMRMGKDREIAAEALALANLCIEKALNEIRYDKNYAGDEIIEINGDSCHILEVENFGENGRTIKAEGEIIGYKKAIRVDAELNSTINIISWKEI